MTTESLSESLSRRGLLKAAAVAIAAGSVGLATARTAPQADAQGRILGTVIDYSAGVPSAASVKAAGHLGAVRYVSYPRPGAEWMIGKPVKLPETQDFANHGLSVASVYQFGKAETADWKQGAAGAAVHAPQAISLHKAAGGPTGRPIYVAIDDNPTRWQYDNQIRPYLQAFSVALTAAGYSMGIYGNYNTIDWAIADGLGSFFWQHNWGSNGMIHPRVTLHQIRIDKDKIDGIGIDINNVYAQDWGQWKPGQSGAPLPSSPSAPSIPGVPATGSTIPELNVNGSSVSSADLQRFSDLTQDVLRLLP
ncbi:DUF1906 domain-containing protein [Corynebacterium guangdongense]|uniref:Rv2525c-like glycoside hydrolase-like domain-containing protein n=1 Tax=Corynebacterium guangdongense TaxID=1783348 RepID=A0ABU1ZX40_9CORY|nr:DUF1906 domain-containing protein [Corynebacterium guangdongense]MDR7328797.1 hypothetical protein [Corynebacterium guangdongense]WJZ17372.1 hypothetical protein CGUA_03900 [Corynebacterium guangdongense]